MTTPREEALASWIPAQRWFGGKGRPIDALEVVSETPLGDGLSHLILRVRQGDETTLYQHMQGDGFPEFLLSACAKEQDIGPLRFRRLAPIDASQPARALKAEQSNTSFIYGHAYMGKVFRQLTPGINPDMELTRALTGRGQVAELYGWYEMDVAGSATTLGMLSEFLHGGIDGWSLATTSEDFTTEARDLGVATARVHRDLAAVFGVTEIPAQAVRVLARTMRTRLDAACAEVPALAAHHKKISEAFSDLAVHGGLPAQRVHGDYHLGQVMLTSGGWRLLDFEGEPSKSLKERRAPAHPLRDVAGMLRSFHYAEHSGHSAGGAARNRTAFCRGYADAGGPDPERHPVPLRAFEYEKAIYEVVYEARNRPGWLHIPLATFG